MPLTFKPSKTIKKEQTDYYDIEPIKATKANVRIIMSDRKNGKSYQVKKEMLENYTEKGGRAVFVRRWDDTIKASNIGSMWRDIIQNGVLKKCVGDKWTDIIYYNRGFYLAKYSKDGRVIKDKTPFCYAVALNKADDLKSSISDPSVNFLHLEEFVSDLGQYLPYEFKAFSSIVSTFKRYHSDDEFVIYLTGNTVSTYNPYVANMGLKRLKYQEIGTIEVYKIPYENGDGEYVVACERAPLPLKKTKVKDGFFEVFDSPYAKMVNTGDFALDIFPTLQEWEEEPNEENVYFRFFVSFDVDNLCCDIVCTDNGKYCYVSEFPREPKFTDPDILIYSDRYFIANNCKRNFMTDKSPASAVIRSMYQQGQFRYSDNFAGDIMQNFIKNVS